VTKICLHPRNDRSGESATDLFNHADAGRFLLFRCLRRGRNLLLRNVIVAASTPPFHPDQREDRASKEDDQVF
jgi:hypothetical protein